ncbi:hypothetical protein P1J78_03215 [Psychromarinibacter sp. C21-152]|uniref:Uncharacterized protein n=1 Tax=Psychromarinibacter sediminicola TaxID=3033385 RepID=A0AAE3NNV0_9RHOB|nr:hypothetical protein [Psychromarinibacter sediminicola]
MDRGKSMGKSRAWAGPGTKNGGAREEVGTAVFMCGRLWEEVGDPRKLL